MVKFNEKIKVEKDNFFLFIYCLKNFFNKDMIKFYFSILLYSIVIIYLCDFIIYNLGFVFYTIIDYGLSFLYFIFKNV